MKHTHRVHLPGSAWFQVSCAFAKDIADAIETKFPRIVSGRNTDKQPYDSIDIVTEKIVALERVSGDGTQAEDSCSYNR